MRKTERGDAAVNDSKFAEPSAMLSVNTPAFMTAIWIAGLDLD
jgi:hypothetical protein